MEEDMGFLIRRALGSDLPHLIQFQLMMAQESEGQQLEPTTLENGMRFVLENPDVGVYWVILSEALGQPVGMCMVTSEWSDWHNAYYWWFQSVYIHPDYRGQGLLETLMETVRKQAKKEAVREMRLYVESNNSRAIRAYGKVGYQSGHYTVMQKPVESD